MVKREWSRESGQVRVVMQVGGWSSEGGGYATEYSPAGQESSDRGQQWQRAGLFYCAEGREREHAGMDTLDSVLTVEVECR